MRPELKYGIAAGVAWWIWSAFEIALGFHSRHLAAGEITSWMVEVIQAVMLVLFLRSLHRQMPLGRLEPWDAALKSLLVSAVFGSLVFIGSLLSLQFFDRDWLPLMLNWKVAQMRATGMTEETIRGYIVATRDAYSPLGLARSCLLITPLVGAVMGVVACIVLNLRWEKANLARP